MKVYYLIYLVLIILFNANIAKSEVVNTNYKLNLKLLGTYIKIGEINSVLTIDKDNYILEYNLQSEKLVNIISSVTGEGKVTGKIIDKRLLPEKYYYTYTRKNKTKTTTIEFEDSNVIAANVVPSYEKSKLTPINDTMLLNVIDPTTSLVIIGSYFLNDECSIGYNIFDGKRRYNLNYSDIYEKDIYKVCTLKQEKLGGFKIKEDKDLFAPAQQIDSYFKKIDEEYIIEKMITKTKFFEILINISIY